MCITREIQREMRPRYAEWHAEACRRRRNDRRFAVASRSRGKKKKIKKGERKRAAGKSRRARDEREKLTMFRARFRDARKVPLAPRERRRLSAAPAATFTRADRDLPSAVPVQRL